MGARVGDEADGPPRRFCRACCRNLSENRLHIVNDDSPKPHIFVLWTPAMNWTAKSPSELLMYCVKRIEGELSDGRKSVGTGYICAVAKPDGAAIPVLVTNKHVIDQVHHLRIFMHT